MHVIPITLSTDRRCRAKAAEGVDAAWVGLEPIPGGAAGVEDVVVGLPQAVREKAFPEVEPNPLDGVGLG